MIVCVVLRSCNLHDRSLCMSERICDMNYKPNRYFLSRPLFRAGHGFSHKVSHTFTGSPRTREELLEATTRTCVEPASLRCTARGAGVALRARISRGGRISSFRAIVR